VFKAPDSIRRWNRSWPSGCEREKQRHKVTSSLHSPVTAALSTLLANTEGEHHHSPWGCACLAAVF